MVQAKVLDAETGKRAEFILLVRDASRLEVEDAFFNTGSAVFLPDVPGVPLPGGAILTPFTNAELWAALQKSQQQFATDVLTKPFEPDDSGDGTSDRQTGLHVIIAALRFLERNPSHSLVIAGHTDRSGDDSFNMRLSEARGRSVLALLEARRADFITACASFNAPEDDPVVLHYAARTRGWPCDPLDQSKASPDEIRAFQERFNTDFSAKIAVDGVVGNETRGAYFDLYQADLDAGAGGKDSMAALRKHLRFVDPNRKVLPCGERFPIENAAQDGFKSQRNRRVELLFFSPPRLPELGATDAAEKIFRRKLFRFTPLDRDTLAVPATGSFVGATSTPMSLTILTGAAVGDADADVEASTRMPAAGRFDPSDPYAFLTPFDELHPNEGVRPRRRNSKPRRVPSVPVADPPVVA